MENQYLNYYKNRSAKELLEVSENPSSYNDEARLAAFIILQKKNVILNKEQLEDLKSIKDSFKRQERVQKAEVEEEKQLHEWYSKSAVLGFSIFLPIFGAFMLSHNLRSCEKHSLPIVVVIIGAVFTFLIPPMGSGLAMMFLISLAINTFVGLVFIKFFWDKYLGKEIEYKRKSIIKMLLIAAVILIFTAIQLNGNPEMANEFLPQK